MEKDIFIERYKRFNISDDEITKHIQTILNFEEFSDKEIEITTVADIKKYMKYLIDENKNDYNNVIHIARYYYYIDKQDEYIHMTKYFNASGVLENIIDRVILYESKEKQADFIKDIDLPPFGLDSKDLPKYTNDFMSKLNKHFPKDNCNKILSGNNHGIPKESFTKEKEFYQNAKSFEEYLQNRHQRKIQELDEHYQNNRVWFEQVITKDAIELVRGNQEILSGVIEGDKLYVTKIPYDIDNYLKTDDDVLKRYYACHCSFVRENIKDGTENIPREWCYCSGGFAKFPFEVILDQELDVKLLKTPIEGDYVCRFEIDLKNVEYKKA